MLVYMLLSVYTLAVIKPVLPLLADAIEHTFNQSGHLLTVHYENGKYHVHQEMVKDAEKETSPKPNTKQNSTTAQEDVNFYTAERSIFCFAPLPVKSKTTFTLPQKNLQKITLPVFAPPPESISMHLFQPSQA